MNITNWDQAYQDHFTPWDKGHASPPLADWVSKNAHVLPRSARILVPGCGLGHDVAYLASEGFDAYGLDISPTAVARAQEAHPQHANRFLQGDLFEHAGNYDALVEHTCLCALPPEWRPRYRDAAARLINPGGILVGIFYINPDLDPGESGPPFGIDDAELTELFGSHFEILDSYIPTVTYPGREGRELFRILRRVPAAQSLLTPRL